MTIRRDFSLIELMIVVSIIGVLSSIAIPKFASMQYRAKRAEVPSNIDGIKTAETAYNASFDRFVAQTALHPSDPLNKQARTWAAGSNFDTIGWAPDGKVRGSYLVNTTDTSFLVLGRCDVDGDGAYAEYHSDQNRNNFRLTSVEVY